MRRFFFGSRQRPSASPGGCEVDAAASPDRPAIGPVPSLTDPIVAVDWGYVPGWTSAAILRVAAACSGFSSFLRQFPDHASAYLQRDWRSSVPGPLDAGTLALEDDPQRADCASRAASLVLGAYSLHEDVKAGRLAQEQFKGRPLETEQYANLFSTHLVVDNGRKTLFRSGQSSEVAVVYRRHLYALPIEGADGRPLSEATLTAQFLEVMTLGAPNPRPVPAVSAAYRSTQQRAFSGPGLEGNHASLKRLRHTFLTVCLEPGTCPGSYKQALVDAHAGNCANRWFGASLQLVVFRRR